MLKRMQQESLKSDERLLRNRHPKLPQNNSFSNSSTLTIWYTLQQQNKLSRRPQTEKLSTYERKST